MSKTDTPAKVASNDRLGPLPEADVRWMDGKDQWGYDDYSHAYSAEAMTAYAAQQVAAERERCAKLCDAEFPRMQSSAERDLCAWLAQRIRKVLTRCQ